MPASKQRMPSRRRRLLYNASTRVVLILGGLMSWSHAASPERPPNIIFILTDDQRWDSLGVTGNPVVKTPHLDRLAAEEVLFVNATVNSAICTPSRASYFLGQYERLHGVNFNSGTAMSEEAWAKSYAVLLRAAGYFTGYIGKNHVRIGAHGYASGVIERSFDFAKTDLRTPKLPPDVLFAEYRQKSYEYVNTEADLRERLIREYQTISGVDRFVGAIRAHLERLGCAGGTIFPLLREARRRARFAAVSAQRERASEMRWRIFQCPVTSSISP